MTQQNTASAEESAAASEELSGQAMHMKDMINRFKVKKATQTGTQPTLPQPARKHAAATTKWGGAPAAPKAGKPSDIISLDDRASG